MGDHSDSASQGDAAQPRDPLDSVTGVVHPPSGDAPARPLVSMGDRCVTCDAPLAPDQRYCLNCGERRGKSRSPAQTTSPAAVEAAPALAQTRREPPKRRVSSGATLVAGIATLLLAMGVGVEIGRLGKSGSAGPARAAAPVQVVTVGGGGSGGGGGASTTPAASRPTHANKAKAAKTSRKSTSAKAVVVTKKVVAKANQAASKVLGASTQNLAPAQIQPGQACSHGAGCQNGKFTGNFFAP